MGLRRLWSGAAVVPRYDGLWRDDRAPAPTYLCGVTQTPSPSVEELARRWAPELWRGFLTVLVARDPRIAQAVTDVLTSQRAVASESPAAVLPWAVDGTRRAFRVRSTPMHDADGRLVGAVTLLEDITHLSEISRLMMGRSCSATPSPWPNCNANASISLSKPNSWAFGHTFAI